MCVCVVLCVCVCVCVCVCECVRVHTHTHTYTHTHALSLSLSLSLSHTHTHTHTHTQQVRCDYMVARPWRMDNVCVMPRPEMDRRQTVWNALVDQYIQGAILILILILPMLT